MGVVLNLHIQHRRIVFRNHEKITEVHVFIYFSPSFSHDVFCVCVCVCLRSVKTHLKSVYRCFRLKSSVIGCLQEYVKRTIETLTKKTHQNALCVHFLACYHLNILFVVAFTLWTDILRCLQRKKEICKHPSS
jgi:hypothetical protein